LALLQAYFDESHIGDHPVTTIGGFVATEKNWASVESAWRALLADLEVPYLHICEMRAQKGVFSSFEQWKIEYAETQCARIIEQNDIVPVYASIHCRDWDSMSGRDWEEFIERNLNPYYLAFEHVVQRSQFYAHRFDEVVAIVFSQQNEFNSRANDIYAGYENSPANKHLGSLTFANMRKVAPLQCADVIASEINEYWERVEGKPDDVGDLISNRPLIV
jgi:hypothetical protein